jgi:hypothetical protein
VVWDLVRGRGPRRTRTPTPREDHPPRQWPLRRGRRVCPPLGRAAQVDSIEFRDESAYVLSAWNLYMDNNFQVLLSNPTCAATTRSRQSPSPSRRSSVPITMIRPSESAGPSPARRGSVPVTMGEQSPARPATAGLRKSVSFSEETSVATLQVGMRQ